MFLVMNCLFVKKLVSGGVESFLVVNMRLDLNHGVKARTDFCNNILCQGSLKDV